MKKQPENKRLIIKLQKDSLKRYKKSLEQNPGSFFYKGLIKNTEEYIEELQQQKS
jgi:hypothetical protein